MPFLITRAWVLHDLYLFQELHHSFWEVNTLSECFYAIIQSSRTWIIRNIKYRKSRSCKEQFGGKTDMDFPVCVCAYTAKKMYVLLKLKRLFAKRCFFMAFFFFFFSLGNFVKEPVTHLNVSAGKKEEENIGSKALVVFMGRAARRYDSRSELVLFISSPHSSLFFLHASPSLLVTPFLVLPT